MPTPFPSPPGFFVGREAAIARFRARLGHFRLFLYAGIAGIGKTALMLRLAKESASCGIQRALYLRVYPGESERSLLARVAARLGYPQIEVDDSHQHPYERMQALLHEARVLLILDDAEQLRAEALAPLIRVFGTTEGDFRVVAAMREEPALSAADRMHVYLERLGALTRDEMAEACTAFNVEGEARDLWLADAVRGGSSAQPLTMRYVLPLIGASPDKSFLAKHSARSVHAFRAFSQLFEAKLGEVDRQLLVMLASWGAPVPLEVAREALGQQVDALVDRGFADLVDGDVCVHEQVSAILGELPAPDSKQAQLVAKSLRSRASERAEPMAAIVAADLLARAGHVDLGIELLAEEWEGVRALGYLEAFLKALSLMPADGHQSRVKLLSVRARMRQGHAERVRTDMEALARADDVWTRSRALESLVFIHSESRDHSATAAAYETLERVSRDSQLLFPAGLLATRALLHGGDAKASDALAKRLQAKLHGSSDDKLRGSVFLQRAKAAAGLGKDDDALQFSQDAIEIFKKGGYHRLVAQAHLFVADLKHQLGRFEEAMRAFSECEASAEEDSDRGMQAVAQLGMAWVEWDVGDLASVRKRLAAFEAERTVAPDLLLKAYLSTVPALLAHASGEHASAALEFSHGAALWERLEQPDRASLVQTYRLRALIASDQHEKAEAAVAELLKEVDAARHPIAMAGLLRESALLKLHRKQTTEALDELSQARKLFSRSGSVREEAMTLHRIARAAAAEGDRQLAGERATEALELALSIKHDRVAALAREVLAQVALDDGDARKAIEEARLAQKDLKRLGDDVGLLYVSELLLRACLSGGELTEAVQTASRLRDWADKAEQPGVRQRALALGGVALLRRGKMEQAQKCFRPPDAQATANPPTDAVMWRLGEGIASVSGTRREVLERRRHWLQSIRSLPQARQLPTLRQLQQLHLPPQDQSDVRTGMGTERMGTEQVAWLDPDAYALFIDVLNRRVRDGQRWFELSAPDLVKVFSRLVVSAPKGVDLNTLHRVALGPAPEGASEEVLREALDPIFKRLDRALGEATHVNFKVTKTTYALLLPKSHCLVVPTTLTVTDLSVSQKKILKLLRKFGTVSLSSIQTDCQLPKSAARRELDALQSAELVIAVKDGRGQSYRLTA